MVDKGLPKVIIHWFRKDLRLHDNNAFRKALVHRNTLLEQQQDGDKKDIHILPLYIMNEEEIKPTDIGVNRM